MKHYLVNNPLILQDENGEDYRVERGEVIELSDEEYAQVAAHVTFAEFHGGVSEEEMANLIDGQTEMPTQNPPENSQEHQTETQTQSEQTSETSEQKQSENTQEHQTETPPETSATNKSKRGKTKDTE